MLNHRILTIISSLILGVLLFSAPAVGKSLPKHFKLKGLYGGTIAPKDLKGKKVVLQFWASWCEGCGDVMGDLSKLLGDDDVIYLPVSVDETISQARGYFRHQKKSVRPLKKDSYLDVDAELASRLGVEALPAVYVVNEKGKVVKSMTGHPTKKEYKRIKRIVTR